MLNNLLHTVLSIQLALEWLVLNSDNTPNFLPEEAPIERLNNSPKKIELTNFYVLSGLIVRKVFNQIEFWVSSYSSTPQRPFTPDEGN